MTHNGIARIDSNQLTTKKVRILIRIKSWLNEAIHSQFPMTFLGFPLKYWLCMTFFGLLTQVPSRQIDSNQLMIQAISRRNLYRFNSWLKWLSKNWLRINSWLKWISKYWFRLTHDSKCFPIFWLKSTHDSSEKHSILSQLTIRVRVIPMSVWGWHHLQDLEPRWTPSLFPPPPLPDRQVPSVYREDSVRHAGDRYRLLSGRGRLSLPAAAAGPAGTVPRAQRTPAQGRSEVVGSGSVRGQRSSVKVSSIRWVTPLVRVNVSTEMLIK